MPKFWPKFVETVRDKGTPSSDDLDDVIAAWFQESADLAMILSEETGLGVIQDISSPSAELRKEEAEDIFKRDKDLTSRFIFPNKNYLSVDLDVDGRCFRFETEHEPTTKVKSSHKQIERFLGNFVSADSPDEWGDHSDVRLFAKWKRKRTETDIPMSDILIDFHEGTIKDSPFLLPDSDLKSLIVRYTPSGAAKEMRSAKKTIEFLEQQAVYFVDTYVDTD